MEKELEDFLDTVIDSLVKLEIAMFYYSNPGTSDTSEGIALRVYRERDETKAALDELASKGVLESVTLGAGKYVLYSLTKDARMLQMLALLDAKYHTDRVSMMEIIRHMYPRKTKPDASSDKDRGRNQ